MHRRHRLPLAAVLVCSTALPRGADAQWQGGLGPSGAVLGAPVGSDVERYVRALMTAGLAPVEGWIARPYDADDLAALLAHDTSAAHPWARALRTALARRTALGVVVSTSANSGFPWGANDGPQWQGRGMNAAIGGAAVVRAGPLVAVAAPVAYVAQNSAFPLLGVRAPGFAAVADASFPNSVDMPQRFGTRRYARAAGGESTVRVRAGAFVAGLTTAAQGWGPGETFPAILGPNAGGFPTIFVGTRAAGLRIPLLGRVNARYLLGTLSQTPWSAVTGSESFEGDSIPGTRRLAIGLTASVRPSLLPGLELGASRFFHSPWRAAGAGRWAAWSKPFEGIFKSSFEGRPDGPAFDPTGDFENQLAAFSARWVLPRRGVELGFEYLREDHSWDWRDLAQEPENNAALAASARIVTHREPTRLAVLTLEYFDGDMRRIAQQRPQGAIYNSFLIRQGHTERGQLLGAPLGVGSIAGQRLAWERFTADGSLRWAVQRWRPRSRVPSDPQGLGVPATTLDERAFDWIIDGSVGLTRTRGPLPVAVDVGLAVAGVWHFGSSRTNAWARAAVPLF